MCHQTDIQVLSGNYRSLRGRTIAAAIMDEIAYFFDEASARPDVEAYRALLPGTVTLREAGSLMIGISTVYKRSGLLFDKVTRYLGKDDPHGLAVQQPTLADDPVLATEIEQQRQDDPEAAAADWDNIWRADLADFINREVVEACTVKGRFELPPQRDLHYAGFVDASGGSSDSMTCAVAHRGKDGIATLDLVSEIRPPFSPMQALPSSSPKCGATASQRSSATTMPISGCMRHFVETAWVMRSPRSASLTFISSSCRY